MPSLSFVAADDFNGTIAVSAAASLEGIAPFWGTFSLGYQGETTSAIYTDATAGELSSFDHDFVWQILTASHAYKRVFPTAKYCTVALGLRSFSLRALPCTRDRAYMRACVYDQRATMLLCCFPRLNMLLGCVLLQLFRGYLLSASTPRSLSRVSLNTPERVRRRCLSSYILCCWRGVS